MRPLLLGDLNCAVAVVLAQPMGQWRWAADRLLWQADLADRYRKRLGRLHPQFGSGSVMAAAAGWPRAPLSHRCDTDYCEALQIVLTAVQDWRERDGRRIVGCDDRHHAIADSAGS